jgi:ribosome-binding protein aMBF1 (putative translation factor)
MGELEPNLDSRTDDIAPDPEPHPGLGRAIRRLRENCGLEQHQLAAKSGVPLSAISDVEQVTKTQVEHGATALRWTGDHPGGSR